MNLQRFLKDTGSGTAVEFALIGPVLFLVVMGIFIMSIAQFWQFNLDDAVRNASRQVQLGNVASGSSFTTAVCNEFGLTSVNCAGSLQYNVQVATLFNSITPATVNASGSLSGNGNFAAPVTGSAMLVQVAYKMPLSLPLLPNSIVTLNGTPDLISAVAAMAEP